MDVTFKRGCGIRDQDSLYLCVATSIFGRSIDFFLVDPAIPWHGKHLRAPMKVSDPTGVNHLIVGIGKMYYPYVPDFIEEARSYGVSKKVPDNFDFSGLIPMKSKFLLMHPRAIPGFPYKVDIDCPKAFGSSHECIGALWSLSAFKECNNRNHHVNLKKNGTAHIKTPSTYYSTLKPEFPLNGKNLTYARGIILSFINWHFEYINKGGFVPSELQEQIESSGFKLDVVPQ